MRDADSTLGSKASSGTAGLDDVLGGGFPVGKIILVGGEPGTGKTTLGLQFLLEGLRQGERCVYVVLSESERDLDRLARSHGWSITGLDIIQGQGDQELAAEDDYTLFHPAEVELGERSRNIIAEIEALKPSRVVLDSMAEVRLLAQDPLRYRRQILALKRLFDGRSTVLLLDLMDAGADRQLESLSHGILYLEQASPEYGGARRRLRVKKLRETRFRDGWHDMTIEKGGIHVFPRIVAAEHAEVQFRPETCSSGIGSLDALLGGGLDRGTSTLVLGPAGVGKSTLAAQFVKAAVDRGERAALFIFDEVPNTFVVRGQGLGMGIREHVKQGRVTIKQVDPAELGPGQFANMVRSAVEGGASIVVIDSINGYQSAMPEEHFLSAHLHELLAYLNHRGVLTLLVMTQQGILGQGVHSPIDVSYLADTVILLRYFEQIGTVKQAASVIKRRTGPHERTIREIELRSDGLHIGDPIRDFHGVLTGRLVHTPIGKRE